MESNSFNHEISAGQLVKNGGWTCNFNMVKYSMENHTLSTYLGIKLIKIVTDDMYSMKFNWCFGLLRTELTRRKYVYCLVHFLVS